MRNKTTLLVLIVLASVTAQADEAVNRSTAGHSNEVRSEEGVATADRHRLPPPYVANRLARNKLARQEGRPDTWLITVLNAIEFPINRTAGISSREQPGSVIKPDIDAGMMADEFERKHHLKL
ncbi:hypothetical protein Pla100_57270 [Neorhodopirellula pilleata]|uniref:Uncharacterized protein n=1 Tax=Neorhodopirellula pilleata TaxID=2714738 RepID=A0A5C5ZLY7_9BACT|nr:hypothetical protein Pla100_57270 [Neorhodopirellula pilleata]